MSLISEKLTDDFTYQRQKMSEGRSQSQHHHTTDKLNAFLGTQVFLLNILVYGMESILARIVKLHVIEKCIMHFGMVDYVCCKLNLLVKSWYLKDNFVFLPVEKKSCQFHITLHSLLGF